MFDFCRVGLAMVAVFGLSGCFLRTPWALEQLNHPGGGNNAAAPKVDLTERVARLTRDHLSDSYLDPQRVATWLGLLTAVRARFALEPLRQGAKAAKEALQTRSNGRRLKCYWPSPS